MATVNATKIEAFDWWLSQGADTRRAQDISAKFGCAIQTAKLWRADFSRALAEKAGRSVTIQLKARVKEYDETAEITASSGVQLAREYKKRIDAIDPEDTKLSTKDLNDLASGLKAVYSLVEAASGADVAKSRAKQADGSESSKGLALPDLGNLDFVADSELIEEKDEPENPLASESASENPVKPAE